MIIVKNKGFDYTDNYNYARDGVIGTCWKINYKGNYIVNFYSLSSLIQSNAPHDCKIEDIFEIAMKSCNSDVSFGVYKYGGITLDNIYNIASAIINSDYGEEFEHIEQCIATKVVITIDMLDDGTERINIRTTNKLVKKFFTVDRFDITFVRDIVYKLQFLINVL